MLINSDRLCRYICIYYVRIEKNIGYVDSWAFVRRLEQRRRNENALIVWKILDSIRMIELDLLHVSIVQCQAASGSFRLIFSSFCLKFVEISLRPHSSTPRNSFEKLTPSL